MIFQCLCEQTERQTNRQTDRHTHSQTPLKPEPAQTTPEHRDPRGWVVNGPHHGAKGPP